MDNPVKMEVINYKEEFNGAVQYIAFHVTRLKEAHDRVNVAEWLRRLSTMKSDDLNTQRLRNEYVQFLQTMMPLGYLIPPFKAPPPPGQLKPLAEALGDNMCDTIRELPRAGNIFPVVTQTTPDGTGSLVMKQTEQGVMCYLSVVPTTREEELNMCD